MVTQTQIIPRIERGFTRLVVHYEDKEITFAYPSIGPDNYMNVGKVILQKNLKLPMYETVSLVHAAYCSDAKDEPEFQNVRQIMRNNWLCVFNLDLWIPRGV